MCIFGKPDVPDVKEPTRYAQQRSPTRRDTGGARERAESRRKRATGTLLTQNVGGVDSTSKKTLLGQ